MRQIDINKLKAIQLNILDFVADFCAKNGINCWLDCGTLEHAGTVLCVHMSASPSNKSVERAEERLRRFGQNDHKRVFGMKADKFLTEAGFDVETIRGEDYSDEILPVVGPADYDMNILFCCRKPERSVPPTPPISPKQFTSDCVVSRGI